MNSKSEEKKYFYGIVESPISCEAHNELLRGITTGHGTGITLGGHELHYSYTDYEYSTVNYGLFGLLSREVKEEVVKHEYFPIILEKKENSYVDVISGENYRVPALPGHIEFRAYETVDLIWLADYLKGMTKEKVGTYVRLMNQLKKAVSVAYQERRWQEIKTQDAYNAADNYINEFRKKYNR